MPKPANQSISPHFRAGDYPAEPSLDQKIEIFDDRIRGWVLDPIERMLGRDKNSEFAALAVLASYFEMYAKYESGFVKENASRTYFDRGVRAVLGEQEGYALTILYKGMRNGLYHGGFPSSQISIGSSSEILAFDSRRRHVQLNATLLLKRIQRHFTNYISRLRDPNETDLRAGFEARFNFELNGVV